jgi:heat shock protein HslJ
MAAERDYLSMLEKVNSWKITDGKLELLTDDKIVARFTEKAAVKK